MTKTLCVLLIVAMTAIAACGPRQDKNESKEMTSQDSVAQAAQFQHEFSKFLLTFVGSINNKNSQENYIHKSIGVYVYTNPGVYCIATNESKTEKKDALIKISADNIFSRTPKGDFCEGYPGERDGFYFSEITKDALPTYYDMASNTDKKIVLPEQLNYKMFVRVNVIKSEYFSSDLYFARIDDSWYIIAQSFCDCSA